MKNRSVRRGTSLHPFQYFPGFFEIASSAPRKVLRAFSKFCNLFRSEVMTSEKNIEFVDLVKRFPVNVKYLIAAIGVDPAENGPFKVWGGGN